MKNKLLSILLTICMVALLLPVSVIPAYAETTTETRTMTWSMNGTGISGSELTNSAGNRLVLSKNSWQGNSTASKPYTQILNENYGLVGTEIIFPDIVGKVKSVELTNVLFAQSGMCLKAGINSSMLLNSTAFASYNDENLKTYTSSFTFSGALDVTAAMPLKLMFMTANTAPEDQLCKFRQGSITVTYEVEVEVPDPEDPGHNFSFNVSGNTLTATCNQQSQYHNCGLSDGKATLTLSVEDCTSNGNFTYNPASINLAEFNQQTGLQATKGDIVYTNNTTGQTTTVASLVTDVGSYTASVTVTIGGNNYTLTKGFNILAGHKVNNNYSQFSVSKTSALEGDEITITFTPQMGETLNGLTLTGATSGNNIAYTQSGNTYTFTMPAEDVNINATITYPLNENDFTQSGDTYTIKTADGWDYFCRRMEVDGELNGFSGKTVELAANITVTTMAGNGRYPFKGTFDGKGHTLTFNHTASAPYSAPFQSTKGATIRNLHVTGQMDGGMWHYNSGLVGYAEGSLTISNCHVSTQISSTVSGTARIGGFVGLLSSQYNQCHITGCVFDGLIYNPNYSGTTYGCGGFVGCFSQYGYAILEDCLFIEGQYDNNNGKCELWWGNENDKNSTFLYRINNQGEGKLTNCFYVGTHGLKQGSPAVESTDAPTNFAHFGDPTDHRFMQTYGHTMVFNGKYYTPIYGDLVENYDYSGVKGYNIEYDDAPLGIPDITSPLWTDVLRYNRSFTKDKPVIVILPFNFTKDNITLANSSQHPSGHFYSFAGVTRWAPVMESANEVTSMTANTPYLYVPGEDTEYLVFYLYDGFYIFTAGNNGGDKTAVSGDWTLTGTYTGKTWTEAEQDFGRTFILNNSGELTDVTDTTIVKPTDGYFVISVNTYTVTFDANGGTGTIAAETVTGGATYTLPACTFTAPEGKIFKEWSVKIGDAEAVNKQPGDTITVTADTTVTATWEWRLQDGYYLIGQNGWTVDALDPEQVFTVNPANANEYMLETTLAVGDTIKVARVADGAIAQWFPDPGDNYTVTADYAGSVTIYFKTTYDSAWSAFGGHIWIEKKVPKFATHSLVLSGQIGVNFFMDLRPLTDAERVGTYMTFTISGRGGVSEEPVYFDASQMNSDALYHTFTCYVSSIQMADTITATYHWFEDGVEQTISEDYSIKQYISAFDAKKGSFDETTVALVHALADYGHYVQAFLAVQNGLKLGTDYAEMDLHYANEYDIDEIADATADNAIVRNNNTGGDVENITYSLRLDSDTSIEVYFKLASGYNGKFTMTPDDGSYTVTKSGGRYIVRFANIPAHKLGKTYTFDVETDHGTAHVEVSALSYVNSMLNASAYADNQPARNAAAAIYAYAAAAAAFMAAH